VCCKKEVRKERNDWKSESKKTDDDQRQMFRDGLGASLPGLRQAEMKMLLVFRKAEDASGVPKNMNHLRVCYARNCLRTIYKYRLDEVIATQARSKEVKGIKA
jgi:hypothetical protein